MLASRLLVSMAVLGLASAGSPMATAQVPRRQPTPNDTLKSTEVAPEKKVTFRIYAPKADEVSVGGDFGRGGKMTKDDRGVWSLDGWPAGSRLLQLHLRRRRRPHRRSQEPDDQAGLIQPGEPVPRSGGRGRVRGDEGRRPRRGPVRLVSLGHAERAAPDARLHPARLRAE